MPKVPIVKGAKLIKVLKKKGKTLGKGITLAILKDAGITTEDFLKLLYNQGI